MRNNINCLLTAPTDDCSFKAALSNASVAELKEAEEALELQFQVGFKVKTKLLAFRRELARRRRKER